MKLDLGEVLTLYYEAVIRVCPECGKHTTPLGDPGIEPYHYCFPCKKRYEWDDPTLKKIKVVKTPQDSASLRRDQE